MKSDTESEFDKEESGELSHIEEAIGDSKSIKKLITNSTKN